MEKACTHKTSLEVKYDIVDIDRWFFKSSDEITSILMKKYNGKENPAIIKEMVEKLLKECEKENQKVVDNSSKHSYSGWTVRD